MPGAQFFCQRDLPKKSAIVTGAAFPLLIKKQANIDRSSSAKNAAMECLQLWFSTGTHVPVNKKFLRELSESGKGLLSVLSNAGTSILATAILDRINQESLDFHVTPCVSRSNNRRGKMILKMFTQELLF